MSGAAGRAACRSSRWAANIGFASGPSSLPFFIITPGLGLDGGVLLAVPGLVVAACSWSRFLTSLARAPGREAPGAGAAAGNNWRGLSLLLAIVGLRSLAHMGPFTFIPLYEISRGQRRELRDRALALFLFAGAVGTLLGGRLADRFGRPVMLGSFVVSAPLILIYASPGGLVGVVALTLSGAAVIGTFGVSLVMSQEYMPGASDGVRADRTRDRPRRGRAALTLGALADAVDLKTAVLARPSARPSASPLRLLLPSSRTVRSAEPAAAPTATY